MPNNIEVVSSTVLVGSKERYIECVMSDGSIWHTDLEGKKWKKIKEPTAELTRLFRRNAND